ncbi:Uncharacterised protein, partial [Mycoplasmoides gallisepticum]
MQNVISQRYNIPALNETQIQTYNQKAAAANQPDYASALLRNFSIVNDNNYLYVNPIRDSSKAAYW